MGIIGGNTSLEIQIIDKDVEYDENGKQKQKYKSIAVLLGYLDLVSGDSKYDYRAKIEGSTHVFICDYTVLGKIDIEKARAVISDITTCKEMKTAICADVKNLTCEDFATKNEIYDIKYIDDPMGLHEQLEIYLKFVGGQNGD